MVRDLRSLILATYLPFGSGFGILNSVLSDKEFLEELKIFRSDTKPLEAAPQEAEGEQPLNRLGRRGAPFRLADILIVFHLSV